MHQDNYSDTLSDDSWKVDALKQYAEVYGEQDTESEWILTPFDTWERNPFYKGEPTPHPECYDYDDWD